MIQRVQTVYLLLSVLVTSQLYFFPVWVHNPLPGETTIGSIGASTHLFLLPVWVIMMLVQIITIFLFKHRKRQLALGRLAILLNVIFIILAFIFINQEKSVINNFSIRDFKGGVTIPLISTILILLANKYIRKDEELIRSMNRLR